MARPTKYKAEFCNDARTFLAKGNSLTAWAGKAGISRETAYQWMQQHPEFSYAISQGRAAGQHIWEQRITKLAVTNEGNASSMIFMMKNLYPHDFREKQHIDQTTTHEAGDSISALMMAINGKTRSI